MKEDIAKNNTSEEFKFSGQIEVVSDGLPRGRFDAIYTCGDRISCRSALPLSNEVMDFILRSGNYVPSETMIRSVTNVFFQYDARIPPKGWNYRFMEKNQNLNLSEIDVIDNDGYLWKIKIESTIDGRHNFFSKKTKTEIKEMKRMQ